MPDAVSLVLSHLRCLICAVLMLPKLGQIGGFAEKWNARIVGWDALVAVCSRAG